MKARRISRKSLAQPGPARSSDQRTRQHIPRPRQTKSSKIPSPPARLPAISPAPTRRPLPRRRRAQPGAPGTLPHSSCPLPQCVVVPAPWPARLRGRLETPPLQRTCPTRGGFGSKLCLARRSSKPEEHNSFESHSKNPTHFRRGRECRPPRGDRHTRPEHFMATPSGQISKPCEGARARESCQPSSWSSCRFSPRQPPPRPPGLWQPAGHQRAPLSRARPAGCASTEFG